jgi:hypothetical protein
LVLPELTVIGAMPPARASLASVAKRWAPAIADQLARGQRPEAGLCQQLRATWATSSAILASSRSMVPDSSRR